MDSSAQSRVPRKVTCPAAYDGLPMTDHDEVSILLRPIAGAPWLTHDTAFGTSVVSIADEIGKFPAGLTITGVRLDGSDSLTAWSIPSP